MICKKRGFIRALWGIHEHEGRRFYKRRTKLDNDISFFKKNPFSHDFKVYVFGEDNAKACEDHGFDTVLLDKRPIVWDMDTEQFRHKLEVFDKAMEDFDEIVFLDWDTLPVEKIPENFWDVLNEKEEIQMTLNQYRRRKAMWRKGDTRKLCCASFVYCRNKIHTEGFIDTWEKMGRPWSEEIAMAKYTDSLKGGWKGKDHYWDNYEPYWFALPKVYWAHDKQKILNEKHSVFRHFDKRQVAKILNMKNVKEENWKTWGLS